LLQLARQNWLLTHLLRTHLLLELTDLRYLVATLVAQVQVTQFVADVDLVFRFRLEN